MTHRVLKRQNPSGSSPLSEVRSSVFPLSPGTGQLTTPYLEVTHTTGLLKQKLQCP